MPWIGRVAWYQEMPLPTWQALDLVDLWAEAWYLVSWRGTLWPTSWEWDSMGRSVQYPFVYLAVVKTQSKKYQKWNYTYRVRHICRTATSLQLLHCLSSPLEMWSDSNIASLQVRDLTDRAHGDRGDMAALQTVGLKGHDQCFVVRKTWKQDKTAVFLRKPSRAFRSS